MEYHHPLWWVGWVGGNWRYMNMLRLRILLVILYIEPCCLPGASLHLHLNQIAHAHFPTIPSMIYNLLICLFLHPKVTVCSVSIAVNHVIFLFKPPHRFSNGYSISHPSNSHHPSPPAPTISRINPNYPMHNPLTTPPPFFH